MMSSRDRATAYVVSKGRHIAEVPLYDSTAHGEQFEQFHTVCDNQRMTMTFITTTRAGVLCGIASNWDSTSGYVGDPEAVLFDDTGSHHPTPGTPHAIFCNAKHGPTWGLFGHTSASYPTWTHKDVMAILRVQVFRVLDGPSLADAVSKITTDMKVITEAMDAAMSKIDDTVMGMERSFGLGLEKVRDTAALGLQALSRQVEVISDGHSGNTPSNIELQAAIVRMSAELVELRSSLSFVAGLPAVFWVRLFAVPPSDPTVPSTFTAFLVAPTVSVVDGLKDAVKLKVPEKLVGVSVLRLQVWGHDAVTKRWVSVDEDTVLVANDKATAYHVVVKT